MAVSKHCQGNDQNRHEGWPARRRHANACNRHTPLDAKAARMTPTDLSCHNAAHKSRIRRAISLFETGSRASALMRKGRQGPAVVHAETQAGRLVKDSTHNSTTRHKGRQGPAVGHAETPAGRLVKGSTHHSTRQTRGEPLASSAGLASGWSTGMGGRPAWPTRLDAKLRGSTQNFTKATRTLDKVHTHATHTHRRAGARHTHKRGRHTH